METVRKQSHDFLRLQLWLLWIGVSDNQAFVYYLVAKKCKTMLDLDIFCSLYSFFLHSHKNPIYFLKIKECNPQQHWLLKRIICLNLPPGVSDTNSSLDIIMSFSLRVFPDRVRCNYVVEPSDSDTWNHRVVLAEGRLRRERWQTELTALFVLCSHTLVRQFRKWQVWLCAVCLKGTKWGVIQTSARCHLTSTLSGLHLRTRHLSAKTFSPGLHADKNKSYAYFRSYSKCFSRF